MQVSQLQGLVEASERTRQEQEQGIRRQTSRAQESQANVTSLAAKIGENHSTVDNGITQHLQVLFNSLVPRLHTPAFFHFLR